MTCCPICGSAGDPRFETTDENQRVSADLFVYAACNCCGTIFLANPPADLKRYYEPDYYEIPSPGRLAAIAAKDRHKIDVVNRFARAKRLLEIGPAFGVFVLQARNEGYDVDALEMDERCCQSLREIEQVRVIQSDAPHQAIAALPRHDVIALWHVIEHLPAIPALVEAAAANLAPDGMLVLATPNPHAAQLRLMGAKWPHLDAPRHLALIPPDTLASLGAKHGLRLEWMTTDDPDARSWNRFGWQRLLMNRFRGRLMRRAMYVAGFAASLLLSQFDRREGRGSAYTMVLRKPAQ